MEEKMTENISVQPEGIRNLVHTLLVGSLTNAPFDSESEELNEFLSEASYITSDDIRDLGTELNGGSTRRYKTRVRYLAALMPDKSLHELANGIHFIMDNNHLSVTEVRDILRGEKRDVPLEKIQKIGKLLSEGKSLRSIARDIQVSFDTVERIEGFLGIAESRRLKLVDYACDAVRSNWSVRKFAASASIPKSTAHTIMRKAKSVLVELGEINE